MTSWAGSESTADGQRERRWRRQESSDGAGFGGGGGWYGCEVGGSTVIHHAVIRQTGGPWVALSIPTWEACKWRGRAVIIYSPQLLTLDSELITAEGKSDRTWRVPEPVTLISVRCLQQEVWEEELASVGSCCGFARACLYIFVCISARWGKQWWREGVGVHTAEWLNHDSRWHMIGPLMDQNTAGICAIITVHFAGSSAEKIFMS